MFADGTFQQGPVVNIRTKNHCMVQVDVDRTLIVGGLIDTQVRNMQARNYSG